MKAFFYSGSTTFLFYIQNFEHVRNVINHKLINLFFVVILFIYVGYVILSYESISRESDPMDRYL